MRLSTRIFLILAVVLLLFYISANLFILIKGKKIIIAQISELTNTKTTIDALYILPPVNLLIKELKVGEGLKVNEISASMSLLGLLTGKIGFNSINILSPEIYYELTPPLEAPVVPLELVTEKKRPGTPELFIKRLRIRGAKINLIDKVVNKEGLAISLKNVDIKIDNVYTLKSKIMTYFEIEGDIPWNGKDALGKIDATGWVNLTKKDIQAKLRISNIDAVYLYPYYYFWVDLKSARIEKAKLNFSSDIHGMNNDVNAQCHLELLDIVRRPLGPDESQEKASVITDTVLAMFKAANEGKVVLDFTVKTKLDKFKFNFSNIQNAFEGKLSEMRKGGGITENIVAFPGKVVGGAVKGVADISKALIEGTFSIGKELKNAIEEPFKKEAPPQEQQ